MKKFLIYRINTSYLYLVILFFSILLSLLYGTVSIHLTSAFSFKNSSDLLILKLRLEESLQAMLCGGCLSVAGLMLQKILKNPLADPYLLGISSGGNFFLCLLIIFYAKLSFFTVKFQFSPIIFFSLIGCLFSTVILFFFKKKCSVNSDLYIYPVLGFIINSFFASATVILTYIVNPDKISEVQNLLLGNFYIFDTWHYIFSLIITFFIIKFLFNQEKLLFCLQFSDEFCMTHNINASHSRRKIILCCCALTAISVSMCGNLGFIGLLTPHISGFLHKKNTKDLIPNNFLLGGIFLVICNLLSKIIFNFISIPIGIITSFIGIIFLSLLMIKKEKKHEN